MYIVMKRFPQYHVSLWTSRINTQPTAQIQFCEYVEVYQRKSGSKVPNIHILLYTNFKPY